jgi:uncharacterized protein
MPQEFGFGGDLVADWKQIRHIFIRSFFSSFHYAIATVSPDGTPHVSPIGSLILDTDKPEGFYFEIFVSHLRQNIEVNPRISVMATHSGLFFWLRSLIAGKFSQPPAIRLHGTAGIRRPATQEEIRLWQKRVGILRFLRGYKLLWGNLTYVREVRFHKFETVKMGRMTAIAEQET